MKEEKPDANVGNQENQEGNVSDTEVAKMTPQQLADLYANAKKMQASATQKFQEVSDIKKQQESLADQLRQLQAEKEYIEEQYQASLDAQNATLNKGTNTPTQPPSYMDDPVAYANYERAERLRIEKELEKTKVEMQQVTDELKVGITALRIDKFLDTDIKREFPDVKKTEVNTWFDEHCDIVPKEETMRRAAREIHENKVEERKKWEADYLKEKEEAEKKAAETPGTPFAGKKIPAAEWNKMSEEQQAAYLKKRITEIK